MANCFLLLACLLFSFACNLVKKIYDNRSYHSTSAMLCSAVLSGLSGFVFALVLSEFFSSPLAIVGLSGIGGFFGTKAVNAIIKTRVGSKLIADDELQELLLETEENENVEEAREEQEIIDTLTERLSEDNIASHVDNACDTISSGLSTVNDHIKIRVVRRK